VREIITGAQKKKTFIKYSFYLSGNCSVFFLCKNIKKLSFEINQPAAFSKKFAILVLQLFFS
jgi:hypothetical protein